MPCSRSSPRTATSRTTTSRCSRCTIPATPAPAAHRDSPEDLLEQLRDLAHQVADALVLRQVEVGAGVAGERGELLAPRTREDHDRDLLERDRAAQIGAEPRARRVGHPRLGEQYVRLALADEVRELGDVGGRAHAVAL